MSLRSLLEKATEAWNKSNDDRLGMEWNCTVESEYGAVCFMANDVADPEYSHANAALIVALHNCAEEMLKAVEAAREYSESRDAIHSIHVDIVKHDALRAALQRLKQKEAATCR